MVNFRSEFDERSVGELTLSTVIENRARAIGDRVFVYYGDQDREVTYTELHEQTNAIGNSLVSMGLGGQQKIAVMLRDPLRTILAMYGINNAGSVFSPINYDYKGSVLAYQLTDLDPDALIIEDQYASRLSAITDDVSLDCPIIVSHTATGGASDIQESASFGELVSGSTGTGTTDVAWYDTASILYTSGTTGRPKGVMLPYRWIFYYTLLRQVLINEDDVIHVPKPLYHVGAAYWSVTSALITGASVALWNTFSVSEFWDRINQYNATTATLVSVMVSWLLDAPASPRDDHNSLRKVQLVPLPENYDDIAARFGFDIVTSAYAQSESGMSICGIINTNYESPSEYRFGKRVRDIKCDASWYGIPVVDRAPGDRWVGKPMSFVDTAIVDEHDEPIGEEQAGELVLRPNVPCTLFSGYYSSPERTLESFRNLWFHTGDALYYDDETNYYFVDRIGDLIRRRGENISTAHIRDVFNDHPHVTDSAVFPVPSDEDDEDAIAIAIQPAEDADITTEDLDRYAYTELPAFMTPDHYFFVDTIPATGTNKIQKYKLKEQFQ